jgi:hypothetical protein
VAGWRGRDRCGKCSYVPGPRLALEPVLRFDHARRPHAIGR